MLSSSHPSLRVWSSVAVPCDIRTRDQAPPIPIERVSIILLCVCGGGSVLKGEQLKLVHNVTATVKGSPDVSRVHAHRCLRGLRQEVPALAYCRAPEIARSSQHLLSDGVVQCVVVGWRAQIWTRLPQKLESVRPFAVPRPLQCLPTGSFAVGTCAVDSNVEDKELLLRA